MNPLLLIPAAISAFSALKGASAAKKSANAQKDIARKQEALYNTATPFYNQTLQALASNAGLGQQQVPGQGNLYSNVSNQQLGVFNNPADRLRLLGAEENINKGLASRQNQLSMALGRRGLTGSNYDIASRAALGSQAEQQRGGFARNLAINAGGEQERRLQLLLNALNPGLGSGPAASNAYGQIGANQAAGAANIAGNLGGAAQQYALLQGLQDNNGGGGGGVQYTGAGQDVNNLMNNGLPNYSTPGIGYGNPEAFTPNPAYGYSAPQLGFNATGAGGPAQPGDPNYNPWDAFGKA